MSLKKLFLFLIFAVGFFLLFKNRASAAVPCDLNGDSTNRIYQSASWSEYRCENFAGATNPGCQRVSQSGRFECTGYNQNNVCTAVTTANDTCTDRFVDDGCHGSVCGHYECTIVHNKKTVVCTNQPKPKQTCQPKTINCEGKCGLWDRGCNNDGVSDKDCGQCGGNQFCDFNVNDSGTRTGGYCKNNPPGNTCNPKSCTDLGAPAPGINTGGSGDPCGKQLNQCGGTTAVCGGCKNGFQCKGANANGVGGHCAPDPVNPPTPGPSDPPPPKGSVTVLVFYDTYANASQKGIENSYTNCYPAADGSGGGSQGSATVNFKINSKQDGTKNVNYTSFKNCKNGSSTGYKVQVNDRTRNVVLNQSQLLPNYYATGYNYQIDGGPVVRCTGTQDNCSDTLNSTPDLSGKDVVVRFGVEKRTTPPPPPPPGQITGFVFVDDNGNDQYEPGAGGNDELCYDSVGNNEKVSIRYGGGTADDFTQKPNCKPFRYNNNGTNPISLTKIPTGYKATGFEYQDAGNNCDINGGEELVDGWCLHDLGTNAGSETINLQGTAEVHFGIKPNPPSPSFSVSGAVFVDDNSPFGKKNNNDHNYFNDCPPNNPCAAKYRTISAYAINDKGVVATSPTTSAASIGSGYSLTLDPGKYRIKYYDPATSTAGPPPNYSMTYPTVGNPPQYVDVKVGSSDCWIERSGQTSTANGASCNQGSVQELNFGISGGGNPPPWFQSMGGDMRIEGGFADPIPAGRVASNVSGNALDPGILFTAQPSASLWNGSPQSARASSNGWLSVSNPFHQFGGGTRTSWYYLISTINHGGVDTSQGIQGAGYCGTYQNGSKRPISDCALGGIQSRVYKTNGDLTIVDAGKSAGNPTVPAGQNVIILVPGNLNINTNIYVPTTSTLVIAVSGDITVDNSVTEIDGIYTAQGKFIAPGPNNGNASLLNVYGEIIANSGAALAAPYSIDSVFPNDRSLADNSTSPSIRIYPRPDFLTHLPETLKVPNYVIQEVAPGPAYSFGTGGGANPSPTNGPSNTPTPSPTHVPTPTPTPARAYIETGGVVAIEAEHADTRVSGSSGDTWDNVADITASNNTLIKANPNNGNSRTPGTDSAEARYRVYFNTPGTYYFFARGNPSDITSNNVVAGINGTPDANNIVFTATGSLTWSDSDTSNNTTSINIPAKGAYTLSLWEKKDGMKIDKIQLKQVDNPPSGVGQPEACRKVYPANSCP